MKKIVLALLFSLSGMTALADEGPRMEDVVAAPADYTGKTLVFTNATLSGTITKYDVDGIRKYYLTVGSKRGTLEAGFFLAPPSLADGLYDRMSSRRNYSVNLTCKVAKIVLNDVPQWHCFVTRVDFLDGDGNVTDTVKEITKKK